MADGWNKREIVLVIGGAPSPPSRHGHSVIIKISLYYIALITHPRYLLLFTLFLLCSLLLACILCCLCKIFILMVTAMSHFEIERFQPTVFVVTLLRMSLDSTSSHTCELEECFKRCTEAGDEAREVILGKESEGFCHAFPAGAEAFHSSLLPLKK